MWGTFKIKSKKEFIIKYKYGRYDYDTIIFAKDKEKAIKKFTDYEVYTNIIAVTEV